MEQLKRAERYLARVRAIYTGTFAHSHDQRDYEDDLLSFFMHCYHIRDWIVHLNSVGLTAKDVDNFINANRCLQLCADLCNGTKHCKLDRAARSGSQPHISGKAYTASTWFTGSEGGEVLRAKYVIITSNGSVDALQLAEDCMECWSKFVVELETKFNQQSGGDLARDV